MNKKKILTITAVFLSVLFAVGGWYLTSILIETKSDSLLSSSGITKSEPQVNITSASDQSKLPANASLTYEEMLNVLKNWESPGWERYHEPAANQINMEQAIRAAKAFIKDFRKCALMSKTKIRLNNMKAVAYLCQNQPYENYDLILSPIYSYWLVDLRNNAIDITLTINAVTGQVWRISIDTVKYTETIKNTVENALDLFISKLGLESGHLEFDSLPIDSMAIYKSLSDYKNGDASAEETDLPKSKSRRPDLDNFSGTHETSVGDTDTDDNIIAILRATRQQKRNKKIEFYLQIFISHSLPQK